MAYYPETGKCRTGAMICALLMYMGRCANHKEALDYFGQAGLRLFYLPQWMWQGPGLYQVKKSGTATGLFTCFAEIYKTVR